MSVTSRISKASILSTISLMTSGSYNPNHNDELNPDYFMCGGRWHATNVSKFFACYSFIICIIVSALNFWWFGADKRWVSIICMAYTTLCITTIYGVFLEKKFCLIPFLLLQGVICIALLTVFSVYGIGGIFTNMIQDHHKESQPLRDLYEMHGLNPDREAGDKRARNLPLAIVYYCAGPAPISAHDRTVQTIVGTLVLLFILLSVIFNCLGLCSMWSTYKCYREQDRIRNQKYQRGIIAESGEV